MFWSYVVYGLWFLAWVILEVLGWKRGKTRVPWKTLSETSWALEKRFTFLRLAFLAGLVILAVHIVFGFPSQTPLG